jgi:hypothetical protein
MKLQELVVGYFCGLAHLAICWPHAVPVVVALIMGTARCGCRHSGAPASIFLSCWDR